MNLIKITTLQFLFLDCSFSAKTGNNKTSTLFGYKFFAKDVRDVIYDWVFELELDYLNDDGNTYSSIVLSGLHSINEE